MTPYIKKIVELHKIHKAIEDKDCNGGGNTPSGDITIDDVVKFIHDDSKNIDPNLFPYTTYSDIPDYNDANSGRPCKGDSHSANTYNFDEVILFTASYLIGFKERGEGES